MSVGFVRTPRRVALLLTALSTAAVVAAQAGGPFVNAAAADVSVPPVPRLTHHSPGTQAAVPTLRTIVRQQPSRMRTAVPVARHLTTAPARATVSHVVLDDDFSGYPATRWADGAVVGNWRTVFTGYGSVAPSKASSRPGLRLSPQRPARPDQTHAALVATTAAYGDLDAGISVRTASQLRSSAPNAWETGWLLWHYTDNAHFYYLILKPNGWELGKEDPGYPGGQRFLATGDTPFPVTRWYDLRVQQTGSTITAWADGRRLVAVTDHERPYLAGALGLYAEDADVTFAGARVKATTSREM